MTSETRNETLVSLTDVLGDALVTGDCLPVSCCTDWSGHPGRRPMALARPATVSAVSQVLRICHEHGCPVVPQGGMTGLAGGAIPDGNAIALSLERLTGETELDAAGGTLTVFAGTTLAQVQRAAAEAGFRYPVDFAVRDSCQIGGTIATNAGGMNVIRHGMTRAQVLGLEVVLADGTVLDLMNTMKKNNAGYDLKHCFIGSEGALGIITRAVLQLAPPLGETQTLLCALDDYASALDLLNRLRTSGLPVEAFEVMWQDFYAMSCGWRVANPPLATSHPLYALCEIEASRAAMRPILDAAMAADEVVDAVLADSQAQSNTLWRIREATAEFPGRLVPISFDVSLPIATLGDFVIEARQTLRDRWPECDIVNFGHIGDGNLHLTIDQKALPADDGSRRHAMEELVYTLVGRWHGSISAEHGIGLLKRDFLHYGVPAEARETMAVIKRALDPSNQLNPGKIFAP